MKFIILVLIFTLKITNVARTEDFFKDLTFQILDDVVQYIEHLKDNPK